MYTVYNNLYVRRQRMVDKNMAFSRKWKKRNAYNHLHKKVALGCEIL
jgi:hypothetical protein